MRTPDDVLAFFVENDDLGEYPDGSNSNWITDWWGLGPVPWCAETVSVALLKAGFGSYDDAKIDLGGIWTRYPWGWAYVPDVRKAFEDAGRFFAEPERGELVIFDWDGDGWGDHVGVFEQDLGDGTCLTREGNADDRITQKRRPYSLISGFCHVPYETTAAAAPAAPEVVPTKRVPVPRRATATLRLSDAGVSFIAAHEGFRPWVYDDASPDKPYTGGTVRGTLTIGYGETRSDIIDRYRLGAQITEEEAKALLRERADGDYAGYLRATVKVPLYQSEFDAATSYTYNLGAANVDDTAFLGRLNAGDYAAAADELGTWPPRPRVAGLWTDADWSTLPGLFDRRREEEGLFRSEWGQYITVDERSPVVATLLAEEDDMQVQFRKRPRTKVPTYDLSKALTNGLVVNGVRYETNIIVQKANPDVKKDPVHARVIGRGFEAGGTKIAVQGGQITEVKPTDIGAVAVVSDDGVELVCTYEQLAGLPA